MHFSIGSLTCIETNNILQEKPHDVNDVSKEKLIFEEKVERKINSQKEFINIMSQFNDDQLKSIQPEELIDFFYYLQWSYPDFLSFLPYLEIIDVTLQIIEQTIRILVIDKQYLLVIVMYLSAFIMISVLYYQQLNDKNQKKQQQKIQKQIQQELFDYIQNFKLYYIYNQRDKFYQRIMPLIREQSELNDLYLLKSKQTQSAISAVAMVIVVLIINRGKNDRILEFNKQEQNPNMDQKDIHIQINQMSEQEKEDVMQQIKSNQVQYDRYENRFFENSGGTLISLREFYVMIYKAVEIYQDLTFDLQFNRFKKQSKRILNIYNYNQQIKNQVSKRDLIQQYDKLEKGDVIYDIMNVNLYVLKKISVQIYKGQKIAIVGPNGNGKSTFLNLMAGLYTYKQAKKIFFLGDDMKYIDRKKFYEVCSIVDQQQQLYNDTIYNNLILGLKDNKGLLKDIWFYIDKLEARQFIEALPKGLNTNVYQVKLSGGQKQILMIIRSLVRKPRVLFLDEHTSYLDTHKAELVQQTIKEYHKKNPDVTIMAITHFSGQLTFYDRLIVIKQGKVYKDADISNGKKIKVDW